MAQDSKITGDERNAARAADARERRRAAVLTGLAGTFLVIGWLIRTFSLAPPTIPTVLFIIVYLSGGGPSALRALGALLRGTFTIDLLMVLAALGAASIGDWPEGGVLLFLFSLSNTLERFALHRTRRAIEALLDLSPSEATVRREGQLMRVPVDQLRVGDRVLVRPGERIPADGIVRAGVSSVDQSPVTGESMPIDKTVGDTVFAGSLNQYGALEIEATLPPSDTTLQRIIRLVEVAQAQKAQSQRFTDWFGERYTVGVLAVAALAAVLPWIALGEPFDTSFYRAMTLLVVASPCAVVISIPAAILSAIARGAARGILVKGGAFLERAATIQAVAFDKTGTLTVGRPRVAAVIPAPGISEAYVLQIAASAESRSEHPLAHAIVDHARAAGVELVACSDLQAIVGRGIRARLATGEVWVGKRALIEESGQTIPPEIDAAAHELASRGHTVMYVADGQRALGIVTAADTLRPTAAEAVQLLRTLGVRAQILLTGDNEAAAHAIAAELGIDYAANLMPAEKLERIRELQRRFGTVAMVGDGINDAPSLATADLGISLGGASTDVALETADLIITGADLRRLPEAIGLARAMNRIIRQNLVFAFGVMATLLLATFLASLRLPIAVVGHEGSTVLVILNALRLLSYRFVPRPPDSPDPSLGKVRGNRLAHL
ncbi:MAG: cadmium-translocating P-type ATPase [Chloroflexi bacterium]|nr:cadmium-translocating P-type ATPase [Chloroflexota bacterium]